MKRDKYMGMDVHQTTTVVAGPGSANRRHCRDSA
jgi:hypothetical protein